MIKKASKIRRILGLHAVLLTAWGMSVGAGAAVQSRVSLAGHVPRQLRSAALVQRTAADENVQLSLAVRLDQSQLDRMLEQLYSHHAPAQKRFLSSSEFAQRFGLADKRNELKIFARANGLTVDAQEDEPDSMVVKVSGSAGVVEKAFGLRLNQYRDPQGRMFRANDTDPSVPSALSPHLGAVLGLSNITGQWKPQFRKKPQAGAASVLPRFTGTGAGGGVAPADIQSIYGLSSVPLTGTGQTVALFELDGYNPADIAAYEAAFGLPSVPLTFIGVDGTTNLCGGVNCAVQDPNVDPDMVEVALDIEMVVAVAHGVSAILVYDGPNSGAGVYDLYNRIATDNRAQVVSTSWGLDEGSTGSSFAQAEAQLFQRMAVQGQSIFAASGDDGAFADGSTLGVGDPASQPYMTAVGGTSLAGTVASPVETAWDGSGGGVSSIWPIPSYQSGVPGLASQTLRNVPDVALNADPNSGYTIYVGGLVGTVGGTSAAAPLWAAFTALVNQQRAVAGTGQLGFANPLLYQLAVSTSSTLVFKDITAGNNGFYTSQAGYDNITGWGPFKGSGMVNNLTNLTAFLAFENLSNVFAYPNPWDTRRTVERRVRIANVPDDASVKIFTLSGFWVTTLSPSAGQAVWDLTNTSGNAVASGLYFYVVSTADATTKGTIAIIK